MRVLHVIPSLSARDGGPTVALHAIVAALTKRGVEVNVATTHGGGLEVKEKSQWCSFRRQSEYYKVALGLRRWLKANVLRFDIVHIHALFSFSSTLAARIAYRANVPYVIRPLGVLNRWGMENRRPFLKRRSFQMIELQILRRAAAIHYTTEAERLEASVVHPGVAQLASFVIPLPVDPPSTPVSAQDFTKRFPNAAGRKVILFMSRLDPKKGIELLLQAFVSVREGEPESLLIIAGDGEDRYVQALRKLADELRISQDVLWTGHLGPAEKAAALAAATVFVLPSYSENFGIAAAEALAAGVPCVLSDKVALAEKVQQGISAIIVPCEVTAIAQAVSQLLSQPEIQEQMSERGREVAAQYFSARAVGEALLDRYQSIILARN
jgi:glycosyltransferase involved in cell wall biosynthesis